MNIGPLLSIIGWGAIGLLVLYIFYVVSMRAQGQTMRISVVIVFLLLFVGIVANVLGAGLVFVERQERAVVISFISGGGLRPEPLEPGLNFIIPFAESIVRYPISEQNYTMSGTAQEGAVVGDDAIAARTSDGQLVNIDASVIFRIDPDSIINLHIKWQQRYINGIVRPQARGIIRDVASQFRVEEVYSLRRDEMASIIADKLREAFEPEGLQLSSFILRNVTFTAEYAASIEQKQIAEQNAIRAEFQVQEEIQVAERVRTRAAGERDRNILEAEGEARSVVLRAEAEAEAIVLRATAEAEALELVSDQLRDNPDLLTFRYIEKLSPSIRTILLPSSSPLLLDVNSLIEQAATAPALVTPPSGDNTP